MIRPTATPRPHRRTVRRTGAFAAALLGAWAAWAAPAMAETRPQATFTLGAGARLTPSYFGSGSEDVGPTGSFQLHHVRIGNFEIGDPMAEPLRRGFRLGGAARYIQTRRGSDHPELAGLLNVGTALELGLRARYVADTWLVFADVRHGVTGHRGWAGEVGADALWQATPNLLISAGPRAAFGDTRFKRTYFGVTQAEADRTDFDAFSPDGGLVSVGAEIGMRLRLDEVWGLTGAIEYARLRGDAGDSPITAQGSRNQWGARLLVTRRFNLRF